MTAQTISPTRLALADRLATESVAAENVARRFSDAIVDDYTQHGRAWLAEQARRYQIASDCLVDQAIALIDEEQAVSS